MVLLIRLQLFPCGGSCGVLMVAGRTLPHPFPICAPDRKVMRDCVDRGCKSVVRTAPGSFLRSMRDQRILIGASLFYRLMARRRLRPVSGPDPYPAHNLRRKPDFSCSAPAKKRGSFRSTPHAIAAFAHGPGYRSRIGDFRR